MANTDQKMLPMVLEKEIVLQNWKVHKYTVTQEVLKPEQAPKSVEGLVTSYTFENKRLSKLVLMSQTYDKISCLDETLEKIIKTMRFQ